MSTDRILSQILGSGAVSAFAGGAAGGLAGNLLSSKGGRKLGKKALKVGGIAAVGGLAYAAWSRYREGQRQEAPDPRAWPETDAARFVPPPERPDEAEALGMLLVRAMVASAQADGRLDGAERHAIYERVGALPLSEPEKAELLAELEAPVDMGELVKAARTPELAAEVYTASLLAIDVDTVAERAYLTMLAARLGLPEALVASIHQEVGVPGAGTGVAA